jgi:exodeoxyribonuclease VII small subunit
MPIQDPGMGRVSFHSQNVSFPNDEGWMEESKSFEDALRALEAVVEKLETGELSLEESLASFETGVTCANRCQELLKAVETQVETLLKKQDGSLTVGKFDE